ncbi:hypothetical protein KIN20_026188 [Parelaphostrongylus tenuis]|uniref:Uncharacterized protein n=1 Tax=Parelaphostrongylus tenuis TaxID=148309 RepID=A0AAD5NBB9_PARTN|nr:hypothetical protein KIN20_026188 [Parelaphostrongylus tenuis]
MKRKANRRFVASGQKTNSARRIRRRPRQTREPASGARDVIDHSSYSLMDEEDIVEMSMLAQEIKSAEKFSLKIEASVSFCVFCLFRFSMISIFFALALRHVMNSSRFSSTR